MYSYTFDKETGGLLLNSTPTNFSKEPRPVYAQEMDLLGFADYWCYEAQNETPYLWAESNTYWYRGEPIAKIKGGDLYHAPVLTPVLDESGEVIFGKTRREILRPIDIAEMCRKNEALLTVLESATVKLIVKEYEKFKNKLDIFHVAFSGGKDSAVLLDLVKKALPAGSFVVIFGDTGMEFPDTYEVVKRTQAICEKDGTPFYIARSHFKPEDSWKVFGPPSRTLRWCCSVHKSVPQTLMMRRILNKNDYVGMAFVGVRKHESITRSQYEIENRDKKQKGQYSYNPILEWTSAEVWLYIYANKLPINEAYMKGNSRAGCLLCPMSLGRSDYIKFKVYNQEIKKFIKIINETSSSIDEESYLSEGGWVSRRNGRNIRGNIQRYSESIEGDKLIINIFSNDSNWKEWIKTLGNLDFEFTITETANGYKIVAPATINKTTAGRYFKQVFKKAAYCVRCGECEANCRYGCVSFENGLQIDNCLHCKGCHEIEDGCLLSHSLDLPEGGVKMKSINSFSSHAPKIEWIRSYFERGDNLWIDPGLGPEQKSFFRTFLIQSGLMRDGKTTHIYELIKRIGYESSASWGILYVNLANDNAQIQWYIKTMDIDILYNRKELEELSINTGSVNPKYTGFIISAYARLCDLPLGYAMKFGYVEKQSGKIAKLCRTKCSIEDSRVMLYALFKFAEKCKLGNDAEFHLSYLFDEETERDGISPVRIFGIYDEEEWRAILQGLSAKYPEFIHATFTNDLKTISLKGKTSAEVLKLFEEE